MAVYGAGLYGAGLYGFGADGGAGSGTGSLGGLKFAWLGARAAGTTMDDREYAYFASVSGLTGAPSLATHKRSYYRQQLGLTQAQAVALSITDLELRYWAMIDPTNIVGSWADRARRFYA